MVTLTKKNHSSPCFWTAFWNLDYFTHTTGGKQRPLKARDQVIYSLNVRADKVIKLKVENVHVDSDLGIAEITPNAINDFCKKYFPSRYEEFVKANKDNSETLIMDLEQILDSFENTPAYQDLVNIIKKKTIDCREEIANLSAFIVFQHIRSHAILKGTLEHFEAAGKERFEYYWLLKQAMGNTNILFELIAPLATSQWRIYRTKNHSFPLPDTPVLMKPGNVMIALSPRMLAEIDLTVHKPEGSWTIINGIPKRKINEYRNRAISNTYKEVIFHDPGVLEKWRARADFKRRVKLSSNVDSYAEFIKRTLAQEGQIFHPPT